jgi:ferredoxin-type protein NapH
VIDANLLDYDHDEEALGFGIPEPKEQPKPTIAHRFAMACCALGGLFLVLQLASGFGIGTWGGIILSYGLLASGALLVFRENFKGTTPGIKHNRTFFRPIQNRGLLGWTLGIAISGFYVVLYFYDDLQRDWGMAPLLARPTQMLDPLAQLMSGSNASRWFLYGFLYTVAVLVFGFRMLLKYRHNRYQQIRTFSVMFFQFGFAFLLPNVLKAFQQPEFYFTYFWPLKPEYLFPSGVDWLSNSSAIGTFFVFWGMLATFVLTPLLTWRFGKRWYCSFVCGCGGLAETLGDPWRQQSSNSTTSWKIERWTIHTVLILITLTTAALWLDLGDFSLSLKKWYGFFIGAIFSGVIGVGFYPLMGSRVWCRFGCPMAAVLGIIQRLWSRFRITTNGDQCMSCGNCSTYCEMGIDVRAYAEKGLNIVRASCVGCGVCAAVCPRGVLSLENGMTPADRFDGADSPLLALAESIKASTVIPERETMLGNSCGSSNCGCKEEKTSSSGD